ncbi:MAG: hypothetical protein MHPSP_003945, partial [Paramarteilia canceri]
NVALSKEIDNIFKAVDAFYYYSDDNFIVSSVTCPPGSFYNGYTDKNYCSQCRDGKSNNNLNNNECNDCLPDYEKLYHQNNDSLECIQCPSGTIYVKTDKRTSERKCTETKCSLYQYFDLDLMKCVDCSEFISNSIGRPKGSLPLYKFCSCQNDYLKVFENDISVKCVTYGQFNNYIDDKLKNSKNDNSYYFIEKNIYQYFTFFDCEPYERHSFIDYYCICNRGFVYRNGGCVPYSNGDKSTHETESDELKSTQIINEFNSTHYDSENSIDIANKNYNKESAFQR